MWSLSVSSLGGPGSDPDHVMCDSWWTKRYWGTFTPSTSVPSATHSTDFSTIIIIIIIIIIHHPGLVR
jgi:hypothetical protein